MKQRKIICALSVLMVLILITGCGAQIEKSQNHQKNDLPISFIDDDGIKIEMEKPAERIVSLYSAHTENLYSLGAGEQVIGGHKTCVYPADAAIKATFDYNGDPEYVIAAEPDLVLIRPFVRKKVPEFIKKIESAGILVVSLYPESFDLFPDYINKLGVLSGREKEAEQKLKEFDQNVADIRDLTKDIQNKQNVFFESTEENVRTVTDDSMAAKAIGWAGGINIAKGAEPMSEGSSIALFGAEKVLENGDNIDVYISQRGSMNAGGNFTSISQRAGFQTVKAVKEGRVYVINEKLISSPTFRVYKGIRELARFLYPQIVDDLSNFENDLPLTRGAFAEIAVKAGHIPLYLPTSSKYYNTPQKLHTFGRFEDVKSEDSNFDYAETAVYCGLVPWEKDESGKEYFKADEPITREQLAKTAFLMGEFKNLGKDVSIKDLESCQSPKIISILVENEVFSLKDGNFLPNEQVTQSEAVKILTAAYNSKAEK